MPSTQRMFVALRPSEEAVADLDDFLEPRREAGPPGLRWSDPEQVHVTLAFAAAVPDRVTEALVEALAAAAARRRSFRATVVGGGAFPDVVGARVLWAGLDLAAEDRVELDRLAVGCRAAVAHAGAEVDGQRFEPHLTVARLSRPRMVSRLVGVLDTYRGPAWTADEVVLVASHLGGGPRGRPRHEVVAALPLGPASAQAAGGEGVEAAPDGGRAWPGGEVGRGDPGDGGVGVAAGRGGA